MAVYVDDMRAQFGRMVMCHMLADTDAELLSMADRIGVQRKWHQHPGTFRSHFDIALSKRAEAIKAGALEIRWRDSGLVNRHRRMVALGKAEPLTIAEILTRGVRACGSNECVAGQRDGVLCANGECDRENGVRPDGVSALPTPKLCPGCAQYHGRNDCPVGWLAPAEPYGVPASEYLAKIKADPRRAAALQRARDRAAGVKVEGGNDAR